MMRASFQKIVLLPALLFAAACGGTSGGVATCTTTTDCASGQTCVSGVCSLGSGGGAGGGSGGGAATGGAIGSACASKSDCKSGLSCLTAADGFSGGYCSASCAINACASGSTCANLSSTPLAGEACLNDCSSSTSCRSGYVCCAAFGKSCTPSAECPASSGGGTSGGTGGGTAGGTGGGSAGGTGGGTAGGTGGGSAGGTAGGTGGGSAGGTGGGSAGGTGGGTAGGTGGGSGGGSSASCGTPTLITGTGNFPSSKPTSCQTPVIAAPTTGYAAGTTVQSLGAHAVGSTVNFNVAAGTGSITIVSQNTKSVTADPTFVFKQSGQSYTLPNGVIPTTLTTPSGDDWYEDNFYPNLADGGPNMDPTTYHAQYGTLGLLPEPTTSALTIPNTSQGIADSVAGYPAGSWSMVVNDDSYECAAGEFTDTANGISCSGGTDAGTYDISVVTKPAISANGKVDIAIYLATSVITAATAPTNVHAQRFVNTIATIYAGLGICVNSVTFYDLPSWAKTLYGGATTSSGTLAAGAGAIDDSKTSTCDGLDQMFTLAQPGNTLNFFFVDSILDQGKEPTGGEEVVGIDGAIPAPSGFSGSVHTGAVVNASDIASGTCTTSVSFTACGADETAYITAHEGGHWMGLYHTTEAVGNGTDPVTDTPVCTCSTACGVSASAAKCCYDANSSTGFTGTCSSGQYTELEGATCTKNTTTCGGGDYLMFWLLDTPSKGTVSQQQGQIARGNLVVH